MADKIPLKGVLLGKEDSSLVNLGKELFEYDSSDYLNYWSLNIYNREFYHNNKKYNLCIWGIDHHSALKYPFLLYDANIGIILINSTSKRSISAALEFLPLVWCNNGKGLIPILFCEVRPNNESPNPQMTKFTSLINSLNEGSETATILWKLVQFNSYDPSLLLSSIVSLIQSYEQKRLQRSISTDHTSIINMLTQFYQGVEIIT